MFEGDVLVDIDCHKIKDICVILQRRLSKKLDINECMDLLNNSDQFDDNEILRVLSRKQEYIRAYNLKKDTKCFLTHPKDLFERVTEVEYLKGVVRNPKETIDYTYVTDVRWGPTIAESLRQYMLTHERSIVDDDRHLQDCLEWLCEEGYFKPIRGKIHPPIPATEYIVDNGMRVDDYLRRRKGRVDKVFTHPFPCFNNIHELTSRKYVYSIKNDFRLPVVEEWDGTVSDCVFVFYGKTQYTWVKLNKLFYRKSTIMKTQWEQYKKIVLVICDENTRKYDGYHPLSQVISKIRSIFIPIVKRIKGNVPTFQYTFENTLAKKI